MSPTQKSLEEAQQISKRAAEQPASVATMQAAKSAERTFAEQPAPEKGETLRAANIARQKEWDEGNQISLTFRGNEMAGECGEACNVIKKIERERMGIKGSRATIEQLADELADVVICADLIASAEGIDLLGEAVPRKFNATSEKHGFKTRLDQPSHPADAGSGEDATTAHGIFDEVLVERLRTYPPEKAHVRTAATRILQLNRDLSAAREQIALAAKQVGDVASRTGGDVNFWKAACDTACEQFKAMRAERDALSQEVAELRIALDAPSKQELEFFDENKRLKEALEPFVRTVAHMEKCRDERPLWAALNSGWAQRDEMPLTVGDLRRAASLARAK